MNPSRRVLAIVGPTASGKSALAVRVALALPAASRWLSATVVGTDSMQVYRGMDIGTATPSPEEMSGVAHRMIDVWAPDREVSVAEFQAEARQSIDETMAGGSLPIVVGGSGLYVSAVLDDLRFPGTDPQVRAKWERELERIGPEALHAQLALLDPPAAAVILPTNGRRIVRALEVIELTGEPFAANLPEPVDVYDTVRIGLEVPRELLDVRIAERVDRMWAAGFVDEVRALLSRGMSRTAERALGYAQAIEQLNGVLTEDEAKASTVAATRRFARRQQRWFRRDQRVQWIPYDATDAVERCLAAVGEDTST